MTKTYKDITYTLKRSSRKTASIYIERDGNVSGKKNGTSMLLCFSLNNSDLKNAGITVGNYTGRYDPSDPASGRDSGTKCMGQHHGISHHETQLEHPPDILLTNYRMLDFLLMRPQDIGDL